MTFSNTIAPAMAGVDGPSKTIFLDSKSPPISLDLSGDNGKDGNPGNDRYGEGRYYDQDSDSRCHNSDVGTVARNITMSSGSTGESGENGENGGNGGNLTVYYDRLSDLKNILVNASAGYGGQGGRGSRGSRGCRCPQSSWQIEGKTYHCTDGNRGSRGSDGRNGTMGKIGQLRLIAGKTPIAGDNPEVRTTLDKLINQPIALSLNRWDQRSGAKTLLQSGSTIDDIYQQYRDRLEKTAIVQWRSKAPMNPATSRLATSFTLQQNGNLNFEFTDRDVWAMLDQVQGAQETTVMVNALVRQEDALKLSAGLTQKQNRDFTLAIIDTGATSDIVATSFWVKVKGNNSNGRVYGLGNTETYFEGAVPANLVKQDYNRFVLNLGGLPVPEDAFQAGKNLDIEIRMVRSLGNRSATKTIDWSGSVY